jgi:hypothetical protein
MRIFMLFIALLSMLPITLDGALLFTVIESIAFD